jgi:hypothetical protein
MNIEVDDHGTIVVTRVYNPISFLTNAGETLSICMRDTGFEFTYQGVKFNAKQGNIYTVNNNMRQLSFYHVVKAFLGKTFGYGYPVTPMNTWHADHIELFWEFVKGEVLPYCNGIIDVPDEYSVTYANIWFDELEKRKEK